MPNWPIYSQIVAQFYTNTANAINKKYQTWVIVFLNFGSGHPENPDQKNNQDAHQLRRCDAVALF